MAAGQVPLLAALVCLAALSGPALAHSDCYASVGGARGHIYQFDGGRVTANPALGGCLKRDLLLTRSFADKDASSLCELEILASFKAVGGQRSGLSRLSAVTVKVDGKVYRLLAGRKLTVNGQLKSVPHGPDKGVRIFFSGEDLVLAHKRCNFWVGFDGDWTATYWLSGKYRGKLEGLAGDCDGHGKDEVGSWLSEAGCRPVKRKPRCLSSAAKREAVHRCSRVINGKDGCFNREVLRPCIADACSAEGTLRKKILCASFYLQSRRCARHHKPLSWRHRSGCPIKCGPNEHFTSRASPCPATCGSHFFGTPKKCFHLPSAEGCRCKRGFVLDSSNRCVPPKECECLTKLCLDRMPRKKCLKWRARGRCKRFPEVMARFCRLTCGHCETRCGENQFSDKLCKNILRQGKCSKPLYKAVCAATCGRNKCRCPNKRRIESKCSTRYKNRIIKSIRYLPGPHGKCIKSTVVRYEPCGACPSIAKTKLQPCNYCKGVRTGKRTVQYRETHGKHRCLRRVTRVSKKCPCPHSGQLKVVSSRKCVKHTELVRVTKVFKAAEKCTKCKRITRRQVVKKIKCSGRRTVLKKCTSGRKHRKKLVYTKQARNCKCIWKLAKEQNLLCYCSKKRSVKRSCSDGYRIKKITGLRLKNNKCVRWVRQVKRKINCPKRRHAKLICQRKTCKATKISGYYQLNGCKCSKKVVKRLVGKCCCPKGYKKIVRVDRYWKKLIKVQYLLEDHKCRKKTTTRKYRVACPPAKKEARCDKVTGAKVFKKIWYVLKNGDCVKRRSKRVARLHCLHGVYRHVGPCHRSGGKGVSRYRKVRYEYYRRKKGSCSCEKVRRTVKELCGCPQGNFVKTTKCPKTGCNSKKCGSKCHYTKTYFYFTKWSYDGDKHHKRKHCHAKVFKHIHFPCCCASNKRVKTWCRSHKHSVKQVTYTKLSKDKHECVRLRRTTTSRIRCKHNSEGTAIKKRLPHPKPGYYYIATYRWHVKNCRCLSTVAKRTCRKRCNPTKTSRRCNRVTGEWITRKVSWKLRGCRTCVQRVREARTPVHCRRKTKRTKRCDKKTGILTVTVTHWKRKGCKCVQKKRVTRRRCKCPKPIVGKRHCDHESSAYVTRTTYWLLKSGKCVKRRRVKVSQVTCSHSVKRKSVCKAKSGVKLVYIGVLKPKGCRCVRQWSLENRLRCNCNRENNEAKQDRRKYCDKHRNLKVTVTYRYVLKKGSCVRKRQKRYRAYSCPPSFTEKKKCDVKRRIQVTLTHYSVKRKCSCVRAVKRRSRKCGCAHKVRRKRYCRRAEGVVVTELHTERWSHKKERCIKKKTTKSHRVSCSQKTHYSVTKCIKNKHYVETKVYEVRKGCRCIKRRVKKRRNCHCKTITRKYKCPKAGFTRRIVTQIRRWDSAKKRCKTVRYVTRRIRCRCPAGGRKRLCRAGSWVTETISFALRHGRCYKRVKRRKQRVTCRHKIRRRYTACKKTGCKKRHIYTMKLKLDSKRCSCYYAVVKRIACPCCCPKTVKHPKRCVKDGKAWQQVTVGYRVLSGKKCGCKRWLKRKTRPVACTKLRQLVWQPCDRHKCISHQRKVHHVVHGCRCRKISRLTGKKRVCCCRGKTKRKRFCRRSAIYERVTLVRLRNWRCVRIKQLRLLRSWHCKAKRKTVVGKCDRTTCKQPLHTLVYKVSRPHCRCRRVAIKRRHRTCCCLQRPKRTKRCDSATAAWVHTRVYYVFNASKHVCVRRRSTVRTPVRCSKHVKQKKDGSCNRHTCRRVVKQIDHYVHHCRCRRRVKRVSKVCCCPRAKRLPVRCDRSKHQWLRSKITWHLSHGRCVKRVTTKRHQLTCRRDVKTRVLACSRRTCKRKIVKILHRPKGCRCAIRHKITHRTCCCRPAVRSNVKCVNDRDVVRITKRRVFNRHTYKCKTKVVKKLLHRLHKCRNTIYRSKCNKKTRHRTVRKVLRRPKKCRCKVYRRVTHRVLCSCPNTRVKRTKCSKTSCHKSIVKTWYTSSGHGAHFKCRKHRQVIKVRCCCKRNPTSRVYCDRSSGATKRESKWTVFIASRRACVRRRKVVLVRRLACKRGGCKLGKCNKSTGYRIKVCVSYKPLRHKCSCKKRTVKRKIICHCPKSYTKKFCKGDERKLEVRTSWKISRLENRCVKRVKTITNHLECPKRRWREKKCPTKPDCQGKITTNWYQLKKCRCKRITRSKPIVCCCPKPTRVKRCLENQWVTVLTKHNLFKGHCLQKVKRIRVSVRCKRKRVRIGRCRKDCKKHRVILLYEVKNCKCAIAKRIIRTKMCCCPRPKHYKRCKAAKGVVQNIKQFWRLSHGKCLKRRRIVSRKIVCPKGSTRASKCNRHTRKQKVVIVRYSRVACRCHRRKRIRQLLCMCRPPRTVKEKCTSERIKRRVYRITYHLSHPRSKLVKRHCLKRRKVWYTEPCRCPKPTRRQRCSRKGTVLTTKIRKWRLKIVKRLHHRRWIRRRTCVLKITKKHTRIRCKRRSVSWTKCRNFRRKRTTVKHWVHRCKCRRRAVVRVFACNCAKKSTKSRRCDAKAGDLVYTRKSCYSKRGAATCSCTTRRWRKHINCPRRYVRRRLTKRHCGLKRHRAWYNRFSIEWTKRRGCGCVRKRRTVLRFCHCQRGSKRAGCAINGKTWVKTKVTYRPSGSKHGGCKKVKRVTKRRILCRRHAGKPKVKIGGCSKHCKRSVSVRQCYVKNCRRKLYIQSRLQLCCKPKPKRHRYCEKKSGKWVTKTLHYKLVPSGPLLKDRHGRVLAKQLKVVATTKRHYRKVRCPRNKTRENCHRRSGRWEKTQITWRRVGCHCKRRIVRKRGRCKCPPKRVRWGRCHNRHKVRTVIKFFLRSQKCHREVKKRLFLCACPKPRRYTVCDGKGAWKKCHVTYRLKFRQQRCIKKRHCRSRLQTCEASSETRSKCKHCHRIIRTVSWRLNRRKCSCTRITRKRKVECDCWKRNSRKTVCKHGAFVTSIVKYHQKGEKCAKVVRKITRAVRCSRRHIKRILKGTCVKKAGHKRRGYQKLLRLWHERRGCKCYRKRVYSWVPCVCHLIKKYRTKRSVYCSRGHVTVHKKVYYVLKRKSHRCVKRVHKRRTPVVCKGTRTRRSRCKPNGKGDKFSVTRVLRQRSDGKCGCAWRSESTRKNVCHCRPPRRIKRCVQNKTRQQILIRYHPVRGRSHCKGKRRVYNKHLSCPSNFSRRDKCHRCTFSVRKYAYHPEKCRCVARKVATKRLRCCCPNPVTKRHCDAKRHMIVTVRSIYKLRHHRCHRRRVTRTRRVRCGRTRPLYRVSKCSKDGFRKIRKMWRYTVGCLCRKRTVVRKQRCSCPHARVYKPGKCGRRFAHDVWLGYKLKDTGVKIPGTNKPVLKCVKVVVDKRKRRCHCPKPYRRSICRRDNLILRITVSYRLHANSCQRKRVVRKRRLSCRRRPHLVRRIVSPEKCSAKHGYSQKLTYIYVHAKGCHCRKTRRVKHIICDCFRKYGGKKHHVKCVKHNRLFRRSFWMAKRGKGCVKRVKTVAKTIRCAKKVRIRSGPCKRSSGKKSFRIYHLVARHCRCVWQLVRRAKAACRCPPSKRSTRCHKNASWVTTKFKWRLVGSGPKARCVLHKRKIVRHIKCRVGRRVRRSSRCNNSGYKVTEATTRRLVKCKCMKRTERQKCRCRCPKNRKARVCRGSVWVTERITHKLAKCACRTTRQVIREPVSCPKKTRVQGPCRRGKNGDFYKKVVRTSWRISGCKCKRIRKIRHRLCGCDAQQLKRRICESGFVRVTVVWKRLLVNNACRRVRKYRRKERLHCGRVQVRRVCDRRSGKLSVFVIRPYAKSCRCHKRVVRRLRRCGCHQRRKMKVGKCNRHTCRQRLLYLRRVFNKASEECVWRRYQKQRTCCCKGVKRLEKCKHKEGQRVVKVLKRVLRHWSCVTVATEVRHQIKCKRHLTVLKKRQKNGVLKLVKCWTVRKGCGCGKRCKTIFRRYRCKRPLKRKRCICVNGKCRTQLMLKHWRLTHGGCYGQIRVRTRPTVCPPVLFSQSRCAVPTKYGFYRVKRTVHWRQKRCRCVRIIKRQSVVCRCWRSSSKKHCHRRRGLIEHIRVHYRINKGRCVKAIKRTQHRVKCGHKTWRYSRRVAHPKRKDVHLKIYVKHVRIGCNCKKQIKRVPCRSRCRPCIKKRRCSSAGRVLVSSRICWHLSNCRCIRRVVVKRHRVRCPRSRRRTICHRNKKCAVAIATKQYRVQGCRCVAKTKVHRTGRKCCCPGPRKSRKCVRGSIRHRTVRYQLRDGRCHAIVSNAFRPVQCPKKRRHVVRGRCRNGRQAYVQHFWTKRGCRCVRVKRSYHRRCSCRYKIVELVVAVDLHSPEKEGSPNYRSHVSDFLEVVLRQFESGSAKVRTMLFTYSSTVRKHHIESSENDASALFNDFTNSKTNLFGALKAIKAHLVRSRRQYSNKVKRIVLVVTRGRHTKSRRSILLADKIKHMARLFVIGFGSLPKSGRYVKWLASRPRRVHYLRMKKTQEYKFIASRIFEHACRKHCRRRPKRHIGKCKRDTCRRLLTEVTWHRDKRSGKCVRRRRTKSRTCCCRGHNSNRLVCRNGRRLRIIVRYKFDGRRGVCHRRVHKIDTSASLNARCRPVKLRRRGSCNAKGWRRDVLVHRYVTKKSCRCRTKRRHLRAVRCRCPSTRRQRICRRNRRGHWYRVTCRIDYKLHRRGCKKRKNCSKRRVVCRHKKRVVRVRGRCHRHSCRRRNSVVTYSVHKCRCRRRVKTLTQVCCCKRKSRKHSFCNKRRHAIVRVKTHYRLVHGACRPVSRKTEHPIRCRTDRRKLPGHCRRHKNGFYRRVVTQTWHRRGCRCIRQTRKSGLRLCRCSSKRRKVQRCLSRRGVIVTIESWLHPRGNSCKRRSRTVGRERVTCSHRRVRVKGRCGRGKAAKAAAAAAKDGRKFAIETVTWQRRAGCKCRRIRRSHVRLCACTKRVRRVTRCHANRQLSVTLYHHRLAHSRNGSATCKIVRKTRRHRVRCRRPVIRLGRKCHSGKRTVIVKVFTPKKCRCKAKLYRRLIACKAACTDKLPSKVCKKWAASRKIKICRRHPHLADRLCAATCGKCCSKSTIVHVGEHCLLAQNRTLLASQNDTSSNHKLTLAKLTTFEACSRSCLANPHCRAFDYKRSSGHCRLLRINHHSLDRDLPELKPTPGCLLFEKACQRKPKGCPHRRIKKSWACVCRPFFGKGRRPLCYRRALVAVYFRRSRRRCVHKLRRILIPCHDCEDKKRWCQQAARKGKCAKDSRVRKLCPHSCHKCARHRTRAGRAGHGHRLMRRRISACSKSGWRKIVRGGLYYDRRLKLWRVYKGVSHKRCIRCPIGSRLIVGRCTKHGKRKLTWIVVTRHSRRGHHSRPCRIKKKHRVVSCRGCGGLDLVRKVGHCVRKPGHGWHRVVTSTFTERDSRKHRCIVRHHKNTFACSPKCPKRSVSRSRCKCGRRVVCTRYYVTYPGRRRCVAKKITRSEKCVSAASDCNDQIKAHDCQAIKHSGMCSTLHRLCAKTCGRCK